MESVKQWLTRLQKKDQIESVAMDRWNPYRLAIRALVPKARIIADKYHVIRQASEVSTKNLGVPKKIRLTFYR
jgi:Transposase and inactivated derivatives